MDQVNFGAWIGRSDTTSGRISHSLASQLHATLGDPDQPAPGAGDALPLLWHWCAFPPLTHVDALGSDGHPGLGDFLPPVGLPRRMWVGGSLRFHGPIHADEPLSRRSAVRDVTQKAGAAGPMVIVTVDHAIYGARGLAIEERQDIVYLEIPAEFTPPRKRPQEGTPLAHVMPSETLLFRYSALTFNAHRVHYDLPYATEVERYPGLVVHGPLQATLLLREAVRRKGRVPSDFHYRSAHPMFANTPLDLTAIEDGASLQMFAGQDGHQGMQATAIWEETQ